MCTPSWYRRAKTYTWIIKTVLYIKKYINVVEMIRIKNHTFWYKHVFVYLNVIV